MTPPGSSLPLTRVSRRTLFGCAAAALVGVSACRHVNRNHRAGVIIDCSGSYIDDASIVKPDLVRIISRLRGGDTFFVSYITACSASIDLSPPEHIIRRGAFQSRSDIRVLQRQYGTDYTLPEINANYTDIRGALRLAADKHRASQATAGVWFLFSDLGITYAPDCLMARPPLVDLTDVTIVGANIARVDHEPTEAEEVEQYEQYRKRITDFEAEVVNAGGAFLEATTVEQVLDRVLPSAAEEDRRTRAS